MMRAAHFILGGVKKRSRERGDTDLYWSTGEAIVVGASTNTGRDANL